MDRDGDILKLQKQLNYNLKKKYQSFYGESIDVVDLERRTCLGVGFVYGIKIST